MLHYSRTGQAPDYEAGVIDTNVNVPNQRSNENKVINKYGQLLLKFCINTGLKIANGRMFNDNGIGRFTYYSPNGSSTIDYLILNEGNIISKFKVLLKSVESDHCPIQFNISNTKLDDHDDYNPLKIDTCVNDKASCSNVFLWQDEKKQEYQLGLRNEQTCHAFEEMLCAVTDGCKTDTLCDLFNGMIENAISLLFPARKHISKERKYTKNDFPSNPWYDKECKSLKYVVNNIANHRDFNARHGEYNIMLRQYKQLIQRKKRQYQQAKLSELENMRTEDPNSYWKFWKSLNPRNVTAGPTLADFVNYFEQQVYPPHVDYFDYEHMNNIIKQVTSFQHNVEHDKSNTTQFLNSPITAEEIKKAIQK